MVADSRSASDLSIRLATPLGGIESTLLDAGRQTHPYSLSLTLTKHPSSAKTVRYYWNGTLGKEQKKLVFNHLKPSGKQMYQFL
jgi:hypothetical protein